MYDIPLTRGELAFQAQRHSGYGVYFFVVCFTLRLSDGGERRCGEAGARREESGGLWRGFRADAGFVVGYEGRFGVDAVLCGWRRIGWEARVEEELDCAG